MFSAMSMFFFVQDDYKYIYVNTDWVLSLHQVKDQMMEQDPGNWWTRKLEVPSMYKAYLRRKGISEQKMALYGEVPPF